MGWRNTLLDIGINDYNNFSKEELLNMNVYEFGVFSGDSMKEIASVLNKHKIEVHSFYGFDVFTGMPKETAEPIFQDSWDPDIEPDAFNALKRLNFGTTEECASHIQKEVENVFTAKNNKTSTSIIAGLVEETLVQQKDLKPAFYVDFDMDIYSPTKFVFKFLLENKLIVPGTFIGYDDWGGTPDFATFGNGESRAHKEIVDEYGIRMQKLYEVGTEFPHVQNLWIVEEV